MQTKVTHSVERSSWQEQRRYYRIERQYSSQRPPKELVLDLLRAHSDE